MSMSPFMSPPINTLSPCTCPPYMGGDSSPRQVYKV